MTKRKGLIYISNFEMIVTAIIALLAVTMLWFYAKSKNKIIKLLFGVCSGIAVLFPAGYILQTMGSSLPVNVFTLSISGILGIPGVALMAVIQMIV